MSKKYLRWVWIFLVSFLVVITVFFSLARLISPWVSSYRPQLEQYISLKCGRTIKISQMEAGWYYIEPVIRLSGVEIKNKNGHALVAVGHVALGMDILSSLWHWQIEPGVLVASQVSIHMNSSWINGGKVASSSAAKLVPILSSFSKIILKEVSVDWIKDTPEGFSSFAISDAYLKIKRTLVGDYYLKTEFDWQDQQDMDVQSTHVFGALSFRGSLWDAGKEGAGDFSVYVDNLDLAEFQARLRQLFSSETLSAVDLQQGEGNIQVHGNIEKDKADKWQISQGSLDLDTHNLRIDYPAFFNTALPFSSLKTQLEWQKINNVWTLNSKQLFIENSEISADTEYSLQWKKALSDAVIQLTTKFTLRDLPAIRQYLPDNIMKPKLRVWLHRSIVGGTRTTGEMVLRGKLAEFPFDHVSKTSGTENTGLFLVNSDWENFTLDFKEGWPPGKNIQAHVTFRNRDLIANIHQGTIDQLPLTNIKAQILGLGQGKETLEIQGHIKTDAAKARHFVLNSPLKVNLKAFQNMELSGPGIFGISIQIPLYPQNNKNLVNGEAIFLDNDLILKKWWNLDFQHFKGKVVYDQEGILHSEFNASLLGYPLHLNMKTVKKPFPATIADVKAKLGIDALKKIFPLFIFDFMKGASSYQAKLILTSAKQKENKLILDSNLEGVAIQLPQPYGKKAKEKHPLKLELAFSDDENAPSDTKLFIDYDKYLSLYLGYYAKYHGSVKEYVFRQGNISLGGSKAAKPEVDGLRIDGMMPKFSVDEWMPFLKAVTSPKKKDDQKNILRSVQLTMPIIQVGDQILHNDNVLIYPEKNTWMLNIKSDEISGDIQIPSTVGLGIKANLAYVHLDSINSEAQKEKNSSELQPKDIPPLDIQIQSFHYKKMNLGKIQLVTSPDKKVNVLTIKKLTLQSPATSVSFQGKWSQKNSSAHTQLRGKLVSSNLQQTLQNLDIEPVIQGEKGQLNIVLNWHNPPTQFKTDMLNGSANLLIKQGEITHLTKSMQEKIGLGNLLSLFSLQTFPSLSSKGLSFDQLKGSFTLHRGQLKTNDTSLDASVADINMAGTINIPKELYDLVLNIAPRAPLGIPVIATIAGGPVIGLAALAAATLIHQGMKQASIYHYKVTGPWAHPKVESF